ncbi:conserved protein of unknown function [Pseudomonas putida KT2440]|uniref:Phosphoribosyl-AMP cyclohydrolase n=1 Tax=Pseudomonas putida (strain ATCC 47054 / DSM 6125 / CFBP 8728 / NCIMB 11950 / KT2440) TaxID=160488 RepID=Q88HN3_PSEPK|nr:conserved protein of unknown function [Pseudomonas putida KT2440]
MTDVLRHIPWNPLGLIPAITQQHDIGEVLMLAWMNEKALLQYIAGAQQLWALVTL